jgi:hypothetical protein
MKFHSHKNYLQWFKQHSNLFGHSRSNCRSGALPLAVLALLACGCNSAGNTPTAAPALTAAPSRNAVIAPIPFGELNGDKEYNASGVVALADSRFLFCDNNVGDALYELDLTPDGQKKGSLIRRPLQGLTATAIDDLEGMTLAEENGRRYIFIVSSLFVKKAEKEQKGKPAKIPPSGLLRVKVNADESLQAENMPGFRDWLIQQVPELAAAAMLEPDDGGLNIEGLAWDANRRALLLGVRTPVPTGKSLVIPVKVKNLAGAWTTDNLELLPPVRLTPPAPEGELGIRSIEYVPSRSAFLVVLGKAVSESEAPFSLYEWDGQAAGTLKRIEVSFAPKMKPEGVSGGTVGGKPVLLLVDDRGGYQVLSANLP